VLASKIKVKVTPTKGHGQLIQPNHTCYATNVMEQTCYVTNVVEQTLCDKEQTRYATNVVEQMLYIKFMQAHANFLIPKNILFSKIV
jgi:hypothetical protein